LRALQVTSSILALLLVFAFIGCSNDDECASCPETVTPLGTARGFLILDPNATFPEPYFEVSGYGEVMPNLDSMKVGDSLVDRHWEYYWPWEYADARWLIHFDETGDTSTYMYDNGDLATITVWGQGRSSSCRFKVLNPAMAHVNITAPLLYADTITQGGSDTVFWNKVEYVDYYAIMIAWFIPSFGDYFFEYYYSTDTSFVITGAIQPDSMVQHFNVHVTPFNGPDPRTGRTNWDGTLLDGVVCSFGYEGETTIVVRQPPAALKTVAAGHVKAPPEISPVDIISNVYKKYGK
jgi:hypothetical protein